MKAAEFYKAVRPSLKQWAKERGFKRVSSSPPAFTFRDEEHSVLSIWIQLRSGGFHDFTGGSFTLNLQIGDSIGLHTSLTRRLPGTWSAQVKQRALRLDAASRAKRYWSDGPHPFESFMERDKIRLNYYEPLTSLPVDYWMPYYDVEDVESWGVIIAESLDQAMRELIADGKVQGVCVPEVWPPA